MPRLTFTLLKNKKTSSQWALFRAFEVGARASAQVLRSVRAAYGQQAPSASKKYTRPGTKANVLLAVHHAVGAGRCCLSGKALHLGPVPVRMGCVRE